MKWAPFMTASEITDIKHLILEFLKDQEADIFLFGSRSRGNHQWNSDIDIGIIPKERFNPQQLVLLREFFENLNTPYKIDIVDFSNVSEAFREEVLKEAEWWSD
jgi:uncharacterized protein